MGRAQWRWSRIQHAAASVIAAGAMTVGLLRSHVAYVSLFVASMRPHETLPSQDRFSLSALELS